MLELGFVFVGVKDINANLGGVVEIIEVGGFDFKLILGMFFEVELFLKGDYVFFINGVDLERIVRIIICDSVRDVRIVIVVCICGRYVENSSGDCCWFGNGFVVYFLSKYRCIVVDIFDG